MIAKDVAEYLALISFFLYFLHDYPRFFIHYKNSFKLFFVATQTTHFTLYSHFTHHPLYPTHTIHYLYVTNTQSVKLFAYSNTLYKRYFIKDTRKPFIAFVNNVTYVPFFFPLLFFNILWNG